jgi:hypothetical protein
MDREIDNEGCALTLKTFHRQTAAVPVHNMFDDGQTQASARPLTALLTLDSIETFR